MARSDPPLSTFNGILRQITPESLNDLGATMLQVCAPSFAPLDSRQRSDAWERHINRHGRDPNVDSWYVPTQRGRRFSGDLSPDEAPEHRLDVGCYFSVCTDADGNDDDTLVNELNAYRDPRADFYCIFLDCLGRFANSLGFPRSAHIAVLAYPCSRLLRALPVSAKEDIRARIQEKAATGVPFAVTLGCALIKAKVNGVLDLRQLAAQQWFFEAYVPKGPFETDAHDFVGILPEITKLDLGSWSENNRRTHAIGADLRRRGVSALIFPSARSNVHVLTKQGRVVTFGGWNMVNYGRSQDPRSFEHDDAGGWLTEFPYPRITVNRKLDNHGATIGWEIDGLLDVNMVLYELAMMRKELSLKELVKSLFAS